MKRRKKKGSRPVTLRDRRRGFCRTSSEAAAAAVCGAARSRPFKSLVRGSGDKTAVRRPICGGRPTECCARSGRGHALVEPLSRGNARALRIPIITTLAALPPRRPKKKKNYTHTYNNNKPDPLFMFPFFFYYLFFIIFFSLSPRSPYTLYRTCTRAVSLSPAVPRSRAVNGRRPQYRPVRL